MIWNILEGARSLMGTDYPEKELVIRPGTLVTSLVLNVLCSVAQLCLTLCNPMDCIRQAPLSMGFSRQEYWSGLAFPSPGDLPNSEIEPALLHFLRWQVDSLRLNHLGRRFQTNALSRWELQE